jgi:hypothetical protein
MGLLLGLASLQHWYILGWSWVFEAIVSGFFLTVGAVLVISGLTLRSIVQIRKARAPDIPVPQVIEKEMLDKEIIGK